MKILKKSICLLLVLTTVFSFAGCKSNNEEDLLKNPVITLNDFETQIELSTLAMAGQLGKVELNTDEKYVTNGSKSAKVTVIHDPWSYSDDHVLYQGTDLVVRDEDFSNFAKTKRITMDVYNANETVEKIGMRLVYETGSSLSEWFSLTAGEFTTIEYTVARESIPEVTDDGEKSNKVKGIEFLFELPDGKDNLFYLDNLCLYNSFTSVEPLKRSLKTDEIASFDSWWQVASLTVTGGNYAPHTNWSKSMSKDVNPLLKLDCVPGGSTWPTIRIDTEHCAMIDWGSYSGNDAMKFDIYLPEGQWMEVSITLYGASVPMFQKLIVLEAGKWNELSFTVDYIMANPYEGTSRRFSLINGISIGYREFEGTENRQLYIDNIRMERATNE